MEILQSAIDLSRLQFAFVVSFHAIFPVFSIGIASFVALLEALFYKTQNPVYARLSEFWTKVFAIAFGMGVVSGIVMSFQFGTNWSNFSYATANFLGPVLSYEVITAFFLEAAFLGVLLFGREKVPSGVHLFAAIMVAVGTFISSFWILAANSWLHTPAGVEVVDGVFHVRDWVAAIFNPSFPYRFAHMGIASFLTGAFVVAGVSSWFLIRGRDVLAHRKALSMCLWLILFLAPSQVLMGDFHGLNTLEYQPAKIAAMEGNWETSSNVPLLLRTRAQRDSGSRAATRCGGILVVPSDGWIRHADGTCGYCRADQPIPKESVYTGSVPSFSCRDDSCAVYCRSRRVVCHRDGTITVARVRHDDSGRGYHTITHSRSCTRESDRLWYRVRYRVRVGACIHNQNGKERN